MRKPAEPEAAGAFRPAIISRHFVLAIAVILPYMGAIVRFGLRATGARKFTQARQVPVIRVFKHLKT